jgi:hypothetical protein
MRPFVFRKSSYSTPDRECVEVAINIADTVAVRDSKWSDGPHLRFMPTTWAAFQSLLLKS